MHYWKAWNTEVANSVDPPPGLTRDDVIYVNNGNLQITNKSTIPIFEQLSVQNMAAAGFGHTQIVVNNPVDVARAAKAGFGFAVDPFGRKAKGRPYLGLLDTAGGFVYADKACRFALHKARSLGVRFVLGGAAGTFQSFTYSSADSIIGVRTADGLEHQASLTIVACGGWSPTIVPELDGLCETTAGSVCMYQIPRKSPLWNRFAPHNFPTWTYKMRDGKYGGLYGFPRDENG